MMSPTRPSFIRRCICIALLFQCSFGGTLQLDVGAPIEFAVDSITFIDSDVGPSTTPNQSDVFTTGPSIYRRDLSPASLWGAYMSKNRTVGLNHRYIYGLPILAQQLQILLSHAVTDLANQEQGSNTTYYRYDRVRWSLVFKADVDVSVPTIIIRKLASRILSRLPSNDTITNTTVVRLEHNAVPVAIMLFLPVANDTGIDLSDTAGPTIGENVTTLEFTPSGPVVHNASLSADALNFWNTTPPAGSPHDKRDVGEVVQREIFRRIRNNAVVLAIRPRAPRLFDVMRAPVRQLIDVIYDNRPLSTIILISIALIFVPVTILVHLFSVYVNAQLAARRTVSEARQPQNFTANYDQIFTQDHLSWAVEYKVAIQVEYVPEGLTAQSIANEIWAEILTHRNDTVLAITGVMTLDRWDDAWSRSAVWAPAPQPAPAFIYWRLAAWQITTVVHEPSFLKDEL